MFATGSRNSACCAHEPYEDGLYLVGRRYYSAGSESVADAILRSEAKYLFGCDPSLYGRRLTRQWN